MYVPQRIDLLKGLAVKEATLANSFLKRGLLDEARSQIFTGIRGIRDTLRLVNSLRPEEQRFLTI